MYSAETCDLIRGVLETLPDPYWVNRKKINSIPTKGTTDADYWFLGDGQMPPELRDTLWVIAPTIERCDLAEICVNRYEPGTGMPEHIDRAVYRHNMVIALNEDGDGIEIEGVFHPDVKGSGVVFPVRSVPHAVPPNKHRRYVIIFLYE